MGQPLANSSSSEAGDNGTDSDNDEQGIKESLERLLSEVKTAGSFAVTGQCPTMPLPGLVIGGIGSVGLPLSTKLAENIINVSHLSPYGKDVKWPYHYQGTTELIAS